MSDPADTFHAVTTPQPDAGFDPLAEIAEHSAGLARAAEANLTRRSSTVPAWTVADLVWHLTEVHWFWSTIVAGRLPEPPAEESGTRPAGRRAADRPVLGRRRAPGAGAGRRRPGRRVLDLGPAQQNAGFVLRHQVQEAAVHRWDAEHAAGRDIALGTAMSADADRRSS